MAKKSSINKNNRRRKMVAQFAAKRNQLKADAEALPGIRLIDPNVIANTYDQLQQVRGYYTFPRTLDVDHEEVCLRARNDLVALLGEELQGIGTHIGIDLAA